MYSSLGETLHTRRNMSLPNETKHRLSLADKPSHTCETSLLAKHLRSETKHSASVKHYFHRINNLRCETALSLEQRNETPHETFFITINTPPIERNISLRETYYHVNTPRLANHLSLTPSQRNETSRARRNFLH